MPIVNVTASLALIRAGRGRDALPLCEQALVEQEKARAIDPAKAYGWDALRCKAEALIALGRGAEAVSPLERSLTLKKRMFPGDHARAELALARALVASNGDRSRAMQLAIAARAELAAWPFLFSDIREVDAWIAGRGGHT